jgi:hypothetical protein
MHHAFIDESVRPGRYLLTAVLVPTRDLAAVTRLVRQLFPHGNRRTHLSAENSNRRRRLLKAYAALGPLARVVVAHYPGGPDEPAREACLAAIVQRSEEWRIGMLVLDSRGPVRDRVDRQCIAQAVRNGSLRRELHYAHRGSRDEPLLCLPDAIGWAVGASGAWKQLVQAAVAEVLELGPECAEPGGSSNGGEHRVRFRARKRSAIKSVGKRRAGEQLGARSFRNRR